MSDTVSELTWEDGARFEIARRVQLGIDYMRNAYGGETGLDWLSKVVNPIDADDNYLCVLGQVTGDFATNPLILVNGFKYARAWGFYLSVVDINAELTYDDLTDEWRKRISELKKQRADELATRESAGIDDSWYEET